MKISGNHRQYREAVREAFTRSMHNPAVHWTQDQGYFATPDARLIPMDDGEIEIGIACYGGDGDRSMTGTRAEYRLVREALMVCLTADNPDAAFQLERIKLLTHEDVYPNCGGSYCDICRRRSQGTMRTRYLYVCPHGLANEYAVYRISTPAQLAQAQKILSQFDDTSKGNAYFISRSEAEAQCRAARREQKMNIRSGRENDSVGATQIMDLEIG